MGKMKQEKLIWQRLEQDMVNWLEKKYSSRLHFKNSHQAIEGFPTHGFQSDGMLSDGKTLLALEIETGQTHPDTNVGKYWFLYHEYKRYRKIILFHIYTPTFDSYGWRKKLAEFYVERLRSEVPLEYHLKDFRKSGPYEDVLKKIKREIQKKIESEFELTNHPKYEENYGN